MSAHQLLIDIGGTTTQVGIASHGRIAYRTELPTYKPKPSDPCTHELCRTIGSWLVSINPQFLQPSFVLVGVAGVWDAIERQSYLNSFTDAWVTYVSDHVPRCSVLSDIELAVFAAFGAHPGLLLIAGTGSVAARRDGVGSLTRCGGWGPRIDDAGGGFWIGRQALTAVARALDGRGPSTLLLRPVAAHLRVLPMDTAALMNALRSTPVDRAARLAPAVLQYAAESDPVAVRIRGAAIDALVDLVVTLLPWPTMPPQEVCLHGSLFHNHAFTALFNEALQGAGRGLSTRVMNDMLSDAALRLHSSTE